MGLSGGNAPGFCFHGKPSVLVELVELGGAV
jgi:hypothetical protein